MAVAVPETPAQPFHPPAESHLLRAADAAAAVGQHVVVQHRGGCEIQVSQSLLLSCCILLLTWVALTTELLFSFCTAAHDLCLGSLL